ncbi:hypothetical protein Bca101_020793 [Brassica carinata]
MAVAENAGVKVDSSAQNLDNNNTASSATDTKLSCPDDDQSPNSDSSSLYSSDPPTPDSGNRTSETPQKGQTLNKTPNGESGGSLKSEIRDLSDAFSKLNPMAKEFVPPSLARTQSGGFRNGLRFTNNFADGSDHLSRRDKFLFLHLQLFVIISLLIDLESLYVETFRKQITESLELYVFFESYRLIIVGERRSFGQGRRRMNKRTSLAQKDDVIRRTVYVSDIDQQVTEENLAGVFVNCGQVVDCRVCGDPKSVLRFAFVEFTNEEGARAALSMSGTVIGFYPLKVLPSKTAIAPVNPTFLPRSEDEREMCVRTVYCTNIDKRVNQTDLKGFFEMLCGEVHRLRLGDYHHQTRFAFVEFSMAESAIAALNYSGIVLEHSQ